MGRFNADCYSESGWYWMAGLEQELRRELAMELANAPRRRPKVIRDYGL